VKAKSCLLVSFFEEADREPRAGRSIEPPTLVLGGGRAGTKSPLQSSQQTPRWDPCQLLLGSGQPQTVQRNLGQPRPDDEADPAVSVVEACIRVR